MLTTFVVQDTVTAIIVTMRAFPNIGRAELEVLQFVAEHHPVTVRTVAEHFAETKGQVRTTALNIMERLRSKGHLRRRKLEGIYHYSPTVPKSALLRGLVRDFVRNALGGSVAPFVAFLADEAKLDAAEIEELRRTVRELERKERP